MSPQVCGVESLFPSELLYPSPYLAPGSGTIFIPSLPLELNDFFIDNSAAIFTASDQPISLARYYLGRFYNDLPEYMQGLPYTQFDNATGLPEYEETGESSSYEARNWSLIRIILRAFAREIARADYVLRGRVSLTDYETDPRLPHATPPSDGNNFELAFADDVVSIAGSWVTPASVTYADGDLRRNIVDTSVTISGAAGTKYIYARRANEKQRVVIRNATGGTFMLYVDGEYTTTIAPTATAATVQTALEGLTAIAPGDVSVTGDPGGPWDIEWMGSFIGANPDLILIDGSSLTGTDIVFGVESLVNGFGGSFTLDFTTSATPPDASYLLIGEVTFDGTDVTAATTYSLYNGEVDDGYAHYNPYLDDKAADPSHTCAPLSQNEGIPAQMFAVTSTWGLDLWEDLYGLENPNLNPSNIVLYPERRARILKSVHSIRSYKASDFSYLIAQRAAELGITIGDVEEAKFTDSMWDDPSFIVDSESTYPYFLWVSLYDIEDLDTDPAGAAARVATFRSYIQAMLPAHLSLGLDFGPIGGFITGISIVGVDRI